MTSSSFACAGGLRLLPFVGLIGLAACSGGSAGQQEQAATGAVASSDAASPSPGAPASAAATASSPAGGTVPDPDGAVATDAARPTTTDVVLSYLVWDGAAGAVLAGGYVSPVVEDGGTCTLELSRDGESASASSAALPDASTTSCGELRIPGAELEPGEWSAVLTYESDTTSGTSEPLDVQVEQ
jgi:hypothetical protein